jgi:hypothetical protein
MNRLLHQLPPAYHQYDVGSLAIVVDMQVIVSGLRDRRFEDLLQLFWPISAAPTAGQRVHFLG